MVTIQLVVLMVSMTVVRIMVAVYQVVGNVTFLGVIAMTV
jgi:hypothetical protein